MRQQLQRTRTANSRSSSWRHAGSASAPAAGRRSTAHQRRHAPACIGKHHAHRISVVLKPARQAPHLRQAAHTRPVHIPQPHVTIIPRRQQRRLLRCNSVAHAQTLHSRRVRAPLTPRRQLRRKFREECRAVRRRRARKPLGNVSGPRGVAGVFGGKLGNGAVFSHALLAGGRRRPLGQGMKRHTCTRTHAHTHPHTHTHAHIPVAGDETRRHPADRAGRTCFLS